MPLVTAVWAKSSNSCKEKVGPCVGVTDYTLFCSSVRLGTADCAGIHISLSIFPLTWSRRHSRSHSPAVLANSLLCACAGVHISLSIFLLTWSRRHSHSHSPAVLANSLLCACAGVHISLSIFPLTWSRMHSRSHSPGVSAWPCCGRKGHRWSPWPRKRSRRQC